jgi:membrane-bound lytic murein transglycosylase D
MVSNSSIRPYLAVILGGFCAAAAAQTPPPPAVAGMAAAPPPAASLPGAIVAPLPAEAPPAATAITAAPEAAAVTPAATNPLPFPAPAAALAAPAKSDALFPRYAKLNPSVQFWTKVFGQYSELQSVVHSAAHPERIFEVLDFRAEAQSAANKFVLEKSRVAQEKAAKERFEDLLKQVHRKQNAPETMTFDERRVYEMFKHLSGEKRFLNLLGTVRTQRGLKERTEQALQIADRYLPLMERTFASYNLPPQLTRLPIVESSFNVEAYSKSHAAGMWQFIPSSARIYMRLDDVVDDRRDPWTSTDAAARHLRDDYALLGDWPLALTAYNHGRNGIARALQATGGTTLMDLIERHEHPRWGFAGKNYYAEFLAALDVEREYRQRTQPQRSKDPFAFEVVETRHYVPYETLRQLCGADDEMFRKLNPAYRPEVIEGKLYVPPGHLIRVPAGRAQPFQVAYARLGANERFDAQRVQFLLHRVKKGEVLGRIANRYDTTTAAILRANDLRSANMLRVGQVLKVPPHTESRPGPITVAVGESKPAQTRAQKQAESQSRSSKPAGKKPAFKVHKVRAGQTLHSIARSYHVSVSDLRTANNLGNSSHITVGQKLKVPVSS